MLLLTDRKRKFHSHKVGCEVVPCEVDVCNVVKIPVDAGCNRELAVTLDAGLAILRGNHKYILAVLGEIGIDDNFEPVGSTIAANAVQKGCDSLFRSRFWSTCELLSVCRQRCKQRKEQQQCMK